MCMSSGETFPNLHGQLDVTGLAFHIYDTPSSFSVCPSFSCCKMLAFSCLKYSCKVPFYHMFSSSLLLVSKSARPLYLLCSRLLNLLQYGLCQGDFCILGYC